MFLIQSNVYWYLAKPMERYGLHEYMQSHEARCSPFSCHTPPLHLLTLGPLDSSQGALLASALAFELLHHPRSK